MGCPQSKSKSKELTSAAENGVHIQATKTQNDTAQSTKDSSRTPMKTPHPYNDDPLVKGRADDILPPDLPRDASDINEKQHFDKKDNCNNFDSDTKKRVESKETRDNAQNELVTEKSGKQNNERKDQTAYDTGQTFQSVFIANDIPESISQDANTHEKGYSEEVVDVEDVDVGQTVSEITLENQTVEESERDGSRKEETVTMTKIEGKNGSNVSVELETDDGYKYSEISSKWDGPSAVRYIVSKFFLQLAVIWTEN